MAGLADVQGAQCPVAAPLDPMNTRFRHGARPIGSPQARVVTPW